MGELQIRTGVYAVSQMTLEEMFEELYQVSFPQVYCFERNGHWYAKAEMRIKVQGAEFTVSSDMKHETIKSAVSELVERVRNAMKQLAENGAKLS